MEPKDKRQTNEEKAREAIRRMVETGHAVFVNLDSPGMPEGDLKKIQMDEFERQMKKRG